MLPLPSRCTVLALAVAALSLLSTAPAAADSIAPTSITATLAVGESLTVHKTVTVSADTGQGAGAALFDSFGTAAVTSNALAASFSTYSEVALDVSGAPPGVTVATTGPIRGSFERSVQRSFGFDVTFTGAVPGTYSFGVDALVDKVGVARESDRITVTGGNVPAVPEPNAVALFAIGLGLTGGSLRRRRGVAR